MKAAITAKDNSLSSELEPVFENSKCFIIFDTINSKKIEVLPNPFISAVDCKDVLAAQFLISKGIEILVTGQCKPGTLMVLRAAGIRIFIKSIDQISAIIKKFEFVNLGRTFFDHMYN